MRNRTGCEPFRNLLIRNTAIVSIFSQRKVQSFLPDESAKTNTISLLRQKTTKQSRVKQRNHPRHIRHGDSDWEVSSGDLEKVIDILILCQVSELVTESKIADNIKSKKLCLLGKIYRTEFIFSG